ncbi:MAG: PrgI family protein [Candidatus Buchananbacteria bacterium]|nr:PrgI family protein [Candidatus Buchananbacteria bacterium]
MEQITVPQFLDVEDRIIGPITVRQFIEMVIGGIIIFIFYKIFDFSLFVVSGLLVLVITVTFAFIKINGQHFHNFLLNFITTIKNPKLKIWRKTISEADIKMSLKKPKEEKGPEVAVRKKIINASNLSELALIVDTGGVYQGEGVINHVNNLKK